MLVVQKEEDLFLKKIIEDFTKEFISIETKRSYLKDLLLFFNFFKNHHVNFFHPKDITRNHCLHYRDYLLQQYASSTVHRRLVALRSFMKWCFNLQLIEKNPLESLKLPRYDVKNPTLALEDQEVQNLLSMTSHHDLKSSQHRLILLFLLNLGLRRSELTQIKVKDFFQDKEHYLLRIKGKGQKFRFIPINNFLQKELQSYLKKAEEEKFYYTHEDYLFRSNPLDKKPLHPTTIFRIVTRYVKKAGILKRIGAHSCRATVISHLLETQRANIREVAIFAGHSNIETTQRYDKRRNQLNNSAAYKVDYFKKD